MTPAEAIIGRDAPEGEPLFDAIEAATVIKRLANAGYAIVPMEPSKAMLEAAGSTDTIAIINGLIALGLAHAGQHDSTLALAYRAMVNAR